MICELIKDNSKFNGVWNIYIFYNRLFKEKIKEFILMNQLDFKRKI